MGMLKGTGIRRSVGIATLAAFLPLASVGCFGEFKLTRKVYNWNKRVDEDKWIRWFVFLVITIIPIYGLATLIDAVVANSIEFWTGENPIMSDAGTQRVVTGPDGEVITMTLREDRAIDVVIARSDGSEERLVLVREDRSVAAFAVDGSLIARVADGTGGPAVIEGALAR